MTVIPIDLPERPAQIAALLSTRSATDVAAAVRALMEQKKQPTAIAVAERLGGRHGALAGGIIAGLRGYHDRAWALLRRQPAAVWSVAAPSEYVRSGMLCARDEAVTSLWALVKDPPAEVPAESWLELLGPVYAYGEFELAQALFDRLDAAVGDGAGQESAVVLSRDWLPDWVKRPADAPSVPPLEGTTASFAILDYRHPDRFRASANIGDHVQSLAAFSHVVRHQRLEFDGPDSLVDLAVRLQQRVRPEVRRDDRSGRVGLFLAQRDASQHDALPPDTWALAFGWYMHPQYRINFDFPLHPNLRPIFVSFHVSKRDLLTPEAVAYLQRYGPIGCRDRSTVDLLLSAGVDAFFSGCLTTTVSNVFPDTEVTPPADAPWAFVDVRPDREQGFARLHQRRDEVRTTPFVDNVDVATAMLESYRSQYAGLSTSRLHAYLPGRSIGATVKFTPKNASDPRFAGLAPIDDFALDGMRRSINERLEQVLGAALSGAPVDQVYGLWRQLTAPDVAAAKARLARPVGLAGPRSDLVETVTGSVPAPPVGPAEHTVQVAVRVNAHHRGLVAVLLSSIAEHTTRPVHVQLITRTPEIYHVDELERDAKPIRVSVVDARPYPGRIAKPDGRWHYPQETDRFLTVDLSCDVDRLIVLPIGSVVTADLAELADVDLGDRILAATRPVGTQDTSGYTVLMNAAQRLRADSDRSEEIRRIVNQRHGYDFDRFKTELLVVDVRRWREQAVLTKIIAWAENFGLDYREALHAELGADRVDLPARWHVVPGHVADAQDGLVHWVDEPRPWGDEPAPLQDVWLTANQAMRDRVRP
ncbi:MAG TPA: hypothetical protein VIP98_07650 [Microlunatus sp.]